MVLLRSVQRGHAASFTSRQYSLPPSRYDAKGDTIPDDGIEFLGELVIKWSAFLATAERGTYFATYRGSFVGPEPALENEAGAIAA